MGRLNGKVAIITGAAQGMGAEHARRFIAEGATVLITDIDDERGTALAQELGERAAFTALNVASEAGWAAAVALAEARFGPVTALINNAGNTVKKPVAQMTDADFASVMDTHVAGAFALTRAFLPQIRASGRGSVLFTASMASYLGIPHIIGYSAAKTAILGMVRALASELAPDGVRVNGVAPGWIGTEMVRKNTSADPQRLARIMARIPMEKFGQPEDIGWAMAYLLSPAAGYVTGQVLAVDGGAQSGF